MIEYLVVGAIGAWWAGSKSPRTRVVKSKFVGPRSGQTWECEFFPDLGRMIVMRGPHKVVFDRNAHEGWVTVKKLGDPTIATYIERDFVDASRHAKTEAD